MLIRASCLIWQSAGLLRRESDSLLGYQRISPKVCCDRDFTLRTYKTSWPGLAGLVYSNRWESANTLGLAKKPGVVRLSSATVLGCSNRTAPPERALLIQSTQI
jgi:hypothetical protein